jgi:hypothetical protein
MSISGEAEKKQPPENSYERKSLGERPRFLFAANSNCCGVYWHSINRWPGFSAGRMVCFSDRREGRCGSFCEVDWEFLGFGRDCCAG